MSRVCVYTVNESPFYMSMVAHSIQMLRAHNKTLPILLFFIQDESKTTTMRDGQVFTSFSKENLFQICDQLQVQILYRPPFNNYFYLNRKYISDCKEDTIIHMDSDTFIYGDVESLADKYEYLDFVASASLWLESTGFEGEKYLGVKMTPYNSGVMIFNRGWGQKWASALPVLSQELTIRQAPVGDWVRKNTNSLEEVTTNVYVTEQKLKSAYFDSKECHILLNEHDLRARAEKRDSMIIHTYTDHWNEFKNLSSKICRSRLIGRRRSALQ